VSDAPTQSLLPVIVERHFHSGLWVLAGMSVALGLGTAAGSLAYAHFKPGRHGAVLVFTAWAASHVVCAAIVLQGNASVAVALSVVRGVLSGFGYGLWSTLLMRIVPDDKLSRVFSIDTFGCMALMPVGFALSGVLIERTALAATTIVAVGQLVAAALMAAILLRRSVRTAA
jgi:MFS family permease